MSISQAAAELIEEAVEIIDAGGWTQGKLHDLDGGRCILGGLGRACYLNRVAVNDYEWWEAYNTLIGEVKKTGPDYYDGCQADVADFNDTPGRTWEECRDLMMGAAKILREKG